MNQDQDTKLRELLHTWVVSPKPDPDFAASVWRRIAAEQKEDSWTVIWQRVHEWLLVQLPKPAYAAALLAVVVALGATAANVRANQMRDQYRLEHARQYLASIDPLAMAAGGSQPPR